MSSAAIQKSATGLIFSITSLLLNLCCSEAAVTEMTRYMKQLPKFDPVYLSPSMGTLKPQSNGPL